MSEHGQTPDSGGDDRQLPNGGGGGPVPPPPTLVFVRFTTAATARPLAGMPFTVQGSAGSSPPDQVTSVSLTMNGAAVPVVSDGGDWASWHAIVTPATAGGYTFVARVSSTSLGKTASATLQLTAVNILSAAAPTPASLVIPTTTLSFTAGVAVAASPAFTVSSGSWQYQIGTGSWTQPTAAIPASSGVWQLTLALPSAAVQSGGIIPLTIRATGAQNLTATLALSIQPTDTSPPTVTILSAPAEALPGSTPTVSAQVTDKMPGMVFSGVTTQNVSFQLDGQACTATQTTAGDPGTWSATLPALTHAQHTLTVTARDAAGNTNHATRAISVALTSWTRLEPVPRDPTLAEGLQARAADPYWLLARQAAFGELTGQDAASPVSFRLRATSSSLTRFRPARAPGSALPATGPGELLAAGTGPLEMLAEAEAEPAAAGAPRPLFAAQAGLHYRRLLGRAAHAGSLTAYENGLLAAYPLPASQPGTAAQAGIPPPPQAGDPVLAPYAGRVPDGTRLYADLAAALRPTGGGTSALPASPALGGANAAVVTSVARAWLAWYDAISGQELGQHDTWIPERTEYAFSIAAPGPAAETVLASAELDTGELDWHDFDLLASSEATANAAQVSLGAVPADLPGGDTSIVIAGLPAPVTFRGMPNRNWWDFEDATIDFGAITAPVESVTTSVIVEFAMCYGNDHFIVPVSLPIGSVLRVDSLVVTDTFGEVLQVRSIADVDGAAGSFRLFEHAVPAPAGGTPARDPLFLLFPTAGEVTYGPALEEVHFVRDEAAELVWAIEETALGPAGVVVDRTADALAHFQPLVPTPANGTTPAPRTYVLRSDVEANWFPFLLSYLPPTSAGPSPAPQLAMADVPPLAAGQPAPLPWGRILAPFAPVVPASGAAQPGVMLPLEEITSVGTQVVRAWRVARWIDGKQLSWVGRRVRPGRGTGASGLSFDLTI